MKSLILFDVDGTLVLTGGAGLRALERAFEDVFGVARAFEGIPVHGRTDQLILGDAIARARLSSDDTAMDRFWRRYVGRLREEIHRPGPRKGVMPGVPELLEVLHRRSDTFLALLTGNFAESARIKLEHFGLWRYFRCGAFGDDARERNHLVNVAVKRAQACGLSPLPPDRLFIVGDTPLDVACARAAGARAIAVATGSYDAARLRQSGADVVFDDLRDVDAFLGLLT
jgi:phosphoglycolate phosphatase